jgi:GTPase SAR1 family protein
MATSYRHSNAARDKAMAAAGQPAPRFTTIFKMVVVGPSGAGKTSALHALVENTMGLTMHPSTIGMDFKTYRMRYRDDWYKFQLWDTAGQERFSVVCEQFFRNSHAVVGVIDLKQALTDCANQLSEYAAGQRRPTPDLDGNTDTLPPPPDQMGWQEICDRAARSIFERVFRKPLEADRRPDMMVFRGFCKPDRPVMVCLGNKVDLLLSDDGGGLPQQLDDCAIRNALKRLCEQEFNCRYFDTSVKTGQGVKEAFEWAMTQIVDRAQLHIERHGMPQTLKMSLADDPGFSQMYLLRPDQIDLSVIVRPKPNPMDGQDGGATTDNGNDNEPRLDFGCKC